MTGPDNTQHSLSTLQANELTAGRETVIAPHTGPFGQSRQGTLQSLVPSLNAQSTLADLALLAKDRSEEEQGAQPPLCQPLEMHRNLPPCSSPPHAQLTRDEWSI